MKRKAKSTTSAASLTHEELQSMLIAVVGTIRGSDTDDNTYSSILALWTKELKPPPRSKKASGASTAEDRASEIVWYRKAFDYWEDESNCPISDDGVLGGYGRVTPMDVRDSNIFIDRLLICMGPGFKLDRVADCGAGIGRVTRHLLLPRSAHVDLVEQSPRLLNAAPQYMASGDGLEFNPDSVTYLNLGLQDFSPSAATYDLIWVQWVIGHLHDMDCVQFFRRCAAGLKPCGVIVLKDNVLVDDDLTFLWDRADSSVARHMRYLKLLISLSGLQGRSIIKLKSEPDGDSANSASRINTLIDLSAEKVVNQISLSSGEKCVLCRCWKSSKFPLCDGSHVKHNKATGDNVGPVIITAPVL